MRQAAFDTLIAGVAFHIYGDESLVLLVKNRLNRWTIPPPRDRTWKLEILSTTETLDPSEPGPWYFQDEHVRCDADPVSRSARALVCANLEGNDVRVTSIDRILRNLVIWVHLKGGGLVLHAAAVRLRDLAFVFVGPSGAGKSTAARLACEDAGAEPLADDLVLLRAEERGAYMLPTPEGQHPDQEAQRPRGPVSVGGVFTLRKGSEVQTQVLGPGASLAALTMRPFFEVISMDAIIETAGRVLASLPQNSVRRLTFSRNASALARILAELV